MNSGRIIIEHAYGVFKNQWRFLKHFNMNMDKAATVTLTCCVLYNFCEIYAERVLLPEDVAQCPDLYLEFGGML